MPTDQSIRVLLIEDDPDDALLVREWLKDANASFAFEHADRLAAGLARLSQGSINVILLDLSLPDSHGIPTVQQVQALAPDVPIVILTGADDDELALEALEQGAQDYLGKGELAQRPLVRAIRYALERDRSRTALRNSIFQLRRSETELRRSQEETIRRLARAVEFRDKATGDHIERMSSICARLAAQLGLDDEHCLRIATASKLHDIGKIAVPDHILNKAGPLTDQERAIVQTHAENGRQILTGSGSTLLELAETIAWTHHERYDGTGYPRRIAGTDIPIEGRIAAIADVFDALLNNRPYRAALSLDDALTTLAQGRGSQFDPEILDIFFGSLDELFVPDRSTLELPELSSRVA